MVSSEILAFHALFGCDYTAAPSRKREVRLLKYLESIQEVPCAFSNLAEDIVNIGEEITVIEKFIFALVLMRDFNFFLTCTKKDGKSVTVKSFD